MATDALQPQPTHPAWRGAEYERWIARVAPAVDDAAAADPHVTDDGRAIWTDADGYTCIESTLEGAPPTRIAPHVAITSAELERLTNSQRDALDEIAPRAVKDGLSADDLERLCNQATERQLSRVPNPIRCDARADARAAVHEAAPADETAITIARDFGGHARPASDPPIAQILDDYAVARDAIAPWAAVSTLPYALQATAVFHIIENTIHEPLEAGGEARRAIVRQWHQYGGLDGRAWTLTPNDLYAEARRLAEEYSDRNLCRRELRRACRRGVNIETGELLDAIDDLAITDMAHVAEAMIRRNKARRYRCRNLTHTALIELAADGPDALIGAIWGYALPYGIDEPARERLVGEPSWWNRHLRRRIEQARAIVEARLQLVGAGYRAEKRCTARALDARKKQVERNAAMLERTYITDREHPAHSAATASVIDRSRRVADGRPDATATVLRLADVTPTIDARRAEQYVQVLAYQQIVAEHNYEAAMVTTTVPGSMHCNPSHQAHWHGWDGTSPRQANQWLGQKQKLVYAMMRKRGLPSPPTIRCAEAHADGTPHWHAAVAWPAEKTDDVLDCYAKHFHVYMQSSWIDDAGHKHTRKDAHHEHLLEDGSRDASYSDCTIARCDTSGGAGLGTLLSYIMSYINGSTTGAHGKSSQEHRDREDAWRSQWGIRAFATSGLPSLVPWREARRDNLAMRQCRLSQLDPDSPEAEALEEWISIVEAAQNNDFYRYWILQGGLGISDKRKRPVQALRRDELNAHFETVNRLRGVNIVNPSFRSRGGPDAGEIVTRTRTWSAAPAPADAQPAASETNAAPAVVIMPRSPRVATVGLATAANAPSAADAPPTGPPDDPESAQSPPDPTPEPASSQARWDAVGDTLARRVLRGFYVDGKAAEARQGPPPEARTTTDADLERLRAAAKADADAWAKAQRRRGGAPRTTGGATWTVETRDGVRVAIYDAGDGSPAVPRALYPAPQAAAA